MLSRDFSASGKQYIKRNKIVLIVLAAIIALGAIMLIAFGFKGGADIKGYNTFNVNIGASYEADKLNDYTNDINSVLSSSKAELASVQITGKGDAITLVVKYYKDIKDEAKFNTKLASELNLDVSKISAHNEVEPSLDSKDYIYAVACGLIILTIASIYVAFRYNLACTMTVLGSSVLGVMILMAITGIFRLTINSSFLAINIITILLIVGENLMLFDTLEKERVKLEKKNDRSTQLTNSLKANALRQKFMYGALFAIALMFVILMPSTIKQASLIVMFATVVAMFITVYIIPFLWCLTITQVSDKIRVKKVENNKAKQTTTKVEGELENNYTENQVIEVKEDNGETPSNDDNIIVE